MTTTREWIRRIFRLPGSRLTPDVVLAGTLEKAPRIKAVAVAILWDDDTIAFDWSQMTVMEFVWLASMMKQEAMAEANRHRE